MINLLLKYKFRILNLLLLTYIAYRSFAEFPLSKPDPIVLLVALSNAILIICPLLAIARYKKTFIILSLFISMIIGLEIFYIKAYLYRITFGVIASTFETNSAEINNMLSSLSEHIPTFIIYACITFLSFLSIRTEQIKNKIKSKYLLILVLVSCSIIAYKSYRHLKNSENLFNIVKNDLRSYPLLTLSEYYFYWTPSFFSTLTHTISYFNEVYKFRKAVNNPQSFPQELYETKDINIRIPQTIFLVIGESSNRDNYSLYGYPISTTSALDSLQVNNKLLFYKAISPSSVTRDAIPFIFTFGTPRNTELLNTEEGIITLAKKQGYETHWISNQSKTGLYDSPIGFIAVKSDYTSFSKLEESKYIDDLNLVDKVKDIYSNKKQQLFVIHLRGSHQSYKNGYDNTDSNIIKPNTVFPENLDYDRTIHHTNRVLAKLHETFFNVEKCDSINNVLLYTSDHGEAVNIGHGLAYSNMDQFKIPFIVFGCSYFNRVDSIMHKYMDNGIFNSVNFPYVVSEIIGYKVKEEYIEKSKEDILYYQRIDRKIFKFPDNMD